MRLRASSLASCYLLALLALSIAKPVEPEAKANTQKQVLASHDEQKSGKLTQASSNLSVSTASRTDGSKKLTAKQKPTKRQSNFEADPSGGTSRRNEDPWFLDQPPYPLQPYRFAYNVKGSNGLTEQYRQEVGDGKLLTGSYGYVLPDGIYRHVDYVADDQGFRAYIRTSEPGTANQNPSNVVISSTAPSPISSSFASTDPIRSSVQYANDLARISTASNLIDAQLSAANQPTKPFGSIVNNSLRNFTSFSYPPNTPASTQDYTSLNWPYNYQYPWASYPWWLNQTQVKPWTSTSSGASHTSWLPTIRSFQKDPSQRQFSGLSADSGSFPQAGIDSSQLSSQFDSRLGRLLLPSSTLGRSRLVHKLAYDRPLTSRHFNSSIDDSGRFPYDSSSLGWLNLVEHHRNLPELKRQSQDRHHSIVSPLRVLSPDSKPLTASNELVRISGRQEHHQARHHESHLTTLDPRDGQILVSKERASGTKSGAVSEFDYHQPSQRPLGGIKGGVSQLGLLVAPYANQLHRAQHLRIDPTDVGSVKGGTSTTPAPLSPPSPQSVRADLQVTTLIPQKADLAETKQTSTSHEDDRQTSSSAAITQELDEGIKSSTPRYDEVTSRFIRRPETSSDLRSSIALQDVRSMQNTLGLPQPPRSSRGVDQLHLIGDQTERMIGERLNLLDKLLVAHQNRQSQIPSNSNSAASAQETVRINSNELPPPNQKNLSNKHRLISMKKLETIDPPDAKKNSLSSGPLMKVTSLQASKQLQYISNDLGSATRPDLSTNVTSESFDARRLPKDQARLQTEKVSELEKFQQRLKNQQLLLEQAALAKQQQQQQQQPSQSIHELAKSHGATPLVRNKTNKTQVSGENSHVKYDDASENQIFAPREAKSLEAAGGSRSRRQNDVRSPPTSSQASEREKEDEKIQPISRKLLSSVPFVNLGSVNDTTASSESAQVRPPSELAAQIQRWPSILGASEQVKSSADTRGSSTNQRRQQNLNESSANSINLDFINSVTALSMEQMNPFALNSANPALRLETNIQTAESNSHNPNTGIGTGVATTSARFTSPPSLMAALDYHERQKTSDRLSQLLASNPPSTGSTNGRINRLYPSNHRFVLTENSTTSERRQEGGVIESSLIHDSLEGRNNEKPKRFIEVVSSFSGPSNLMLARTPSTQDSGESSQYSSDQILSHTIGSPFRAFRGE